MRKIIITILILLVVGCASRTPVPVGLIPMPIDPDPRKVTTVKYAVENNMANQNHWTLYQAGPEYERVRSILNRLQKGAKITTFSFPLYIADAGDEINASAVENSVILVYKKLPEKVPSDAQLAAVLGHEIAHILAKHVDDTSSKSRAKGVSVAGWALGNATSIGLSVTGYGGLAQGAGKLTQNVTTTIGNGAFVLAYDRRLEYEADHIGMMIMARAGYDPKEAVEFWKHADELFGGDHAAFFSTHPSNSDRLEKLQEYLPTAEQYYNEARKYY